MSTHVLALEGHDGAGKTTLARALCERLGTIYVRPFRGACGASMLEAAEAGDHEQAEALGREMIARATAEHRGSRLVFDRHWITVCTLIPESRWEHWQPAPSTILCWCDFDTTSSRLSVRSEAPRAREWHEKYLEIYQRIAVEYGVPILRTDRFSVGEAIDQLEARVRSG